MHLINLTSILLIAVNYLFSHFIPHTYFFRSSFIWFVYDILYIFVNVYLCVVVVVFVFSIENVMFFTLFRAYLAFFYFKFSHSNFKFNSQNIELFTNWHFHYSNVFRLEKLHGYTYTALTTIETEKKKTNEWIQFKARIHSLYQFTHTQFAHTKFYCMEYRGDLLLCYFVLTTKNFQTKLTSTLQRRWTQTLKSEKKSISKLQFIKTHSRKKKWNWNLKKK